jgi:hypothetical protein
MTKAAKEESANRRDKNGILKCYFREPWNCDL